MGLVFGFPNEMKSHRLGKIKIEMIDKTEYIVPKVPIAVIADWCYWALSSFHVPFLLHSNLPLKRWR